jgi:membrane-anchored protein YejM (alkaline phosphatase superfamily)
MKEVTEGVSRMSESGGNNNKKIITLYTIIAFFLFAFIYSQYLGGLNTSGLSGGLSLYIACSFWLHFMTFMSVAFLSIYFIERILAKRRKMQLVLFAVTGSLLTIYLYVDSKVYSTMNLHLNRFVIESLTQEDALNVIGLSPKLLVLTVLPICLFIAAHFLISPLSRFSVATVTFSRRNVVIFFLLLAVFVGIDKLLFSYFYFKAQPFVFQLRDAPPAYLVPHPYHISKLFGYLPGNAPKVNFTEPLEGLVAASETEHLNYPGNLEGNDIVMIHDFNIVMVVIESLRQQDVDSNTAPFYSKLAKETIKANNHYTGGNTTHFGLFSLLYGLNPYYFQDFRLSQVPPVGISLLRENGYSVYSTTARTMRWYDMEKFMLGKNPDTFLPEDGKNYERDKLVTDRSIEIARSHEKTGKPYLNFILYYTTHADYEHPDTHTIFEPEIKGRVDFSDEKLRGTDRQKLVNRYKNAIHYVDSELERLVKGLQETGSWDNTILVITGDHGEEFFEENSFGHNSNLNEYQMRVPLLMHIPGKGNIDIEKLTSHMDVMQTVLGEIFTSEIEEMPFQGRNILSDDSGVVYVAKAHYQRPGAFAILGNDQKVVVNLQGGFLEIESVSSDSGKGMEADSEMRSGIIGLLKQMRELRK